MKINGISQTLSESKKLTEILAVAGYNLDRIAVEMNGQILKRSAWEKTTISDTDSLEVVSFVGGG